MESTLKNLLKELLDFLDIKVNKISVEHKEENEYYINLESELSSLLIGYHGENIQSLQHVLKLLARKKADSEFSVYLDIDNYRKRQEQSVLELAERKADLVRQGKKPQLLPPMSSYFRRLIHLHLANEKFQDITTESIGEDDRRQIVIKLKNPEE